MYRSLSSLYNPRRRALRPRDAAEPPSLQCSRELGCPSYGDLNTPLNRESPSPSIFAESVLEVVVPESVIASARAGGWEGAGRRLPAAGLEGS